MPKVALEGMQFYAFHGLYPEEQTIGNHYQVDVYLDTKLEKEHKDIKPPADDISTTVNYETIYQICKLEMKKPVRLIETLAQQILKKIVAQYKDREPLELEGYHVEVTSLLVRVSKFNPPLGGRVQRAYVEETYTKK